MTIRTLTAWGINSTGRDGAKGLYISSVIHEGILTAIGPEVQVQFGSAEIASVLATLAEAYPQAIKAAADQIRADEEHYGPPPTGADAYDQWAFARYGDGPVPPAADGPDLIGEIFKRDGRRTWCAETGDGSWESALPTRA